MKPLRYNIALAVANILFALNFSLFASLLEGEGLNLKTIFVMQSFVMVLLLAAWRVACPTRNNKRVKAADELRIALISALSALGWGYLMLQGMSLSSPIDAATIASAGPSLTLILAHAMGRRRLTRMRLWGVGFSLCGVAILVLGLWSTLSSASAAKGNLILAFAVSVAAINTLVLKPFLEQYGLRRIALRYALTALVASLLLFYKEIELTRVATLKMAQGIECYALLLLGGALPLLLLFEGTERLSPLHTSLYRYLQPFVTSVVVIARRQATLNISNYIAFLAIIIGCTLVSKGVDQAE